MPGSNPASKRGVELGEVVAQAELRVGAGRVLGRDLDEHRADRDRRLSSDSYAACQPEGRHGERARGRGRRPGDREARRVLRRGRRAGRHRADGAARASTRSATELSSADPKWLAACAFCELMSMFGFVRALWSAFDRVMPWRRAVVLGFAEQGANVLLPAGGAGGPAFGAYVLTRLGVPADLAASRHAALFLATSTVSFVALVFAGLIGALLGQASLVATLVPALVAAVAITLAVLFAYTESPAEPEGAGRFRMLFWRVRSFTHDGVRTTVELLRHGDKLLIVGSFTYFAFDVAALACAFQAFGGGAPPLGDLRPRVRPRPRGRAAAHAGRRRRHRGRPDRHVRRLRHADLHRRGRGPRLPRLPARPADHPRRRQPVAHPAHARAPAPARGHRRAVREGPAWTRGRPGAAGGRPSPSATPRPRRPRPTAPGARTSR